MDVIHGMPNILSGIMFPFPWRRLKSNAGEQNPQIRERIQSLPSVSPDEGFISRLANASLLCQQVLRSSLRFYAVWYCCYCCWRWCWFGWKGVAKYITISLILLKLLLFTVTRASRIRYTGGKAAVAVLSKAGPAGG